MENWLLGLDGYLLYLTIFLLLMGGAIGLPIPEDIPLIFAGIVAHRGKAKAEILFFVCYVAIILGDLVIYGIGRRFGPALYNKRWFKARVSPDRIKGIRKSLEKRSVVMIFLARHLFYMRTVTFLVSGAVGMSFQRFLLTDIAAAFVSVPLMMWLGFTGADQYEALVSSRRKTNFLSLVFGLVIVVFLIYFYVKRKTNFEAEENGDDAQNGENCT